MRFHKLSKITYFVVMTTETSAEELAQLYRNNVWKLYCLSKSIISDRSL